MIEKININPLDNELPSLYADRLGLFYAQSVTVELKRERGQFFTPPAIANLMASFVQISEQKLKILDPGCGTGILACALIEYLLSKDRVLQDIELIVYETDEEIIPYLQDSLNYLKIWVESKGVGIQISMRQVDFVLANSEVIEKNSGEKYDIVISNPPYFKISKNDKRAISNQKLVSGQTNIYAIFMGISAVLLSKKGELVFITPRSYASGSYFQAFREMFFNSVRVDKIHLFNSRKNAFKRDQVLQETVIVKGSKNKISADGEIQLSSCGGIEDISNAPFKTFKSIELIDFNSRSKILHLPINEKEERVLNLASGWKNTLSDFDIKISTGPVVSFRATKFIQEYFENGTVYLAPLFWLHNIGKMKLDWSKQLKDKGRYIRIEQESRSLLVPNKNYIFLRRFSTKDDKSRLIAAPYFCNYMTSDFIGVENRLNYLYRKDGHLDRKEIVGLCALLNSRLFDTYFGIFNGNVNVSATELREMKFPPLNDIIELGNKIILSNDFSMSNVNDIVDRLFKFEFEMISNE